MWPCTRDNDDEPADRMGHSMGLSHNLKTTSSVKLNLFNRSIPFLMIQRESKRFLAVKMAFSNQCADALHQN